MRRRLLLAGLGGISGLLAGTGVSIILDQSGRVQIRHFLAISIVSVLIGVGLALVALPKWLNTLSSIAGVVLLVITLFTGFAPAHAQAGCQLTISGSAGDTDLLATSAVEPFVIDLSTPVVYRVEALTPPGAATVEIVAKSMPHADPFVSLPDSVLWYGMVDGGVAVTTIRFAREGATGASVLVDGLAAPVPILPWGTLELELRVDTIAGSTRSSVCAESVFLRFVARPLGTPLGWGALGATTIGLSGLATTSVLRRRWSEPDQGHPEKPAFVGPADPIPSVGPHAKFIESNFVDAETGKAIDPGQPLVAGRQYTLRLNLSPAVRTEQRRDEEMPISVKASGNAVAARPVVQLGVAGTPLVIDLPVRMSRAGRHGVDVDLMSAGHLLQTERFELTVVDTDDDYGGPGQTVTTVFSASDFSAAHLRSLKPRSLIVILQHDTTDGSVDSRILDPTGNLLLRYDSVLQPEALVNVGAQVRKILRAILGDESSQRAVIASDHFGDSLVRLAKVGRLLHQTLFPPSVQPGAAGTILEGIAADEIIQVIQNGAGIGLATMPWNLIYDRRFQQAEDGNPVCDSFRDHPVDACPHATDPKVVCPTGFWGFRFIIEQPLVATAGARVADADLPLTTAVAEGGTAAAYLDESLSYSARHREALQETSSLNLLTGYDDLTAALREDAADLFYFYTHHADDPDIGIPGLVIDGHTLTGSALRDLAIRWKRRPLIVINGCASGDYDLDDPLSLIHEFRALGAAGIIATECTVYDPQAGQLAHRLLDALIEGAEVGKTILEIRRSLMGDSNNPIGFAYAVHALADVALHLEPARLEPVAA